MPLGENIKSLLHERKLRQSDLANELGVSQAMISSVIHGKKNFTIKKMNMVAKYFGVTIDELINSDCRFV